MHPVVVFLALAVCASVQASPREVTIDAAFRYDDDVILIVGDEYMVIGSDGTETLTRKRSGATHVPADQHIRAAVRWSTSAYLNYYGDSTQYEVQQSTRKMALVPYYTADENFLKGGAPDAAVFAHNQFRILKGCDYASTQGAHIDSHSPSPLSELRLPCDIDAAWTSRDRSVATFLKGDQIWTLDPSYRATGPVKFHSVYTIRSWKIKPSPDFGFQL